MIAYLTKSALCLMVLLAAYHLLLQKEKMHRFNRFFLLISMVFSLFIPAINIQITQPVVPAIMPDTYIIDEGFPQEIHTDIQSVQVQNVVITHLLTVTDYLLMVYGIGVTILFIRFGRNLLSIYRCIRRNKNIAMEHAKMVLIPNEVVPHSFFNYIFVNEADFKNGLESQLLTHELTHVQQRHSLDIVFVELLKIVFWFNPIFILYKRAIQLNHEFLADEHVLSTDNNIQGYQYLLLLKAGFSAAVNLTSNFNYAITKKRLIMMTHTTPKLRAMLKGIALAPVMMALVLFICTKAIAQVKADAEPDNAQQVKQGKKQAPKFAIPDPGVSDLVSNDSIRIHFVRKDGTKYIKKLSELPAEQQKMLRHSFVKKRPKTQKITPSQKQFNAWKDSSVYGIWLDEKHVSNDVLNNYKATDIVTYYNSRLYGAAKKGRKYAIQADLYTLAKYNELEAKRIYNNQHPRTHVDLYWVADKNSAK